MSEVIPFRAEDRDTVDGSLRPFDLTRLMLETIALENEERALLLEIKLAEGALRGCRSALAWRKQQARNLIEKYGQP